MAREVLIPFIQSSCLWSSGHVVTADHHSPARGIRQWSHGLCDGVQVLSAAPAMQQHYQPAVVQGSGGATGALMDVIQGVAGQDWLA